MDWAYITLMIFMIAWSVQMIFEYLRKVDQVRADIREAVAVQGRASSEAEGAERELQTLRQKVEEVEARAAELAKREKELHVQVTDLKQKYAR